MGSQLPLGLKMPTDGKFAFEQLQAEGRTFHAYVHVPFCAVRCGYCDFNTYTSSELKGYQPGDFVEHLKSEIALSKQVLSELPARRLSTVFFGGGTPTLLPAADLVAAVEILRESYGFEPGAEITVEANPDTVDADALQQLKDGGVTRISFGVQSAVPSVLQTLERTHNPDRVSEVVDAAKMAGLDASIDLIYGAPGETFEQWQQTVDFAISLNVDHISAYALIVEEGTKLAAQINSGKLSEPDEDLEALKYTYLDEKLLANDLHWYELSNWSRTPEKNSAHNVAYWKNQDWWGFGPGAHSHVGQVRWWNVKHPTTYAAALAERRSPGAGMELIDAGTSLVEELMLQIRLRDGVATDLVREINPKAAEVVAGAIAKGWIDSASAFKGQIVLTVTGRLMADALLRELIG